MAAAAGVLSAAPEEPVQSSIDGHIFKPASAEPTQERMAQLNLPDGFTLTTYTDELEAPRMLAVAENGDVYVTQRAPEHNVHLLRDTNGDGQADEVREVASIPHVHGIALRDGRAYLAAIRHLYVADIRPDGSFSDPEVLYDDLPDAGQHPNRTIEFAPDGRLFLSVGSTTNAADEANPESATMLVVKTDGSGREVFAEGLRNTIGFEWHPQTGEFWGMDHGIDWLGDEVHTEELNRIEQGEHYGWPYVFDDGQRNPADDPEEQTGMSWDEFAAMAEAPVLGHTPHSAPMDLVFYTGDQFPDEYRHDAFVSLHGSWNRQEPVGYSIVRIRFDEDGQPQEIEDFLTGFLQDDGRSASGRPCGLALLPDGSMLLADDGGGMVYRIAYRD